MMNKNKGEEELNGMTEKGIKEGNKAKGRSEAREETGRE